jgi:glycosyltransferase involved in cell wall biosynthesis
MDYLKKANERYTSGVFINKPNGPLVSVVFEKYYAIHEPIISVVMPIHNQEKIIIKNIQAILTHTTEVPYEMILILDSCSDRSQDVLLSWLNDLVATFWLTNIVVFASEQPMFETSCDNLGFLCSRGEYILEIQADMEMTQTGYHKQLMRPFLADANVIGVSGRCCHGLTYSDGIGRMGLSIAQPVSSEIDRNVMYMSESCNRGPLMLHRPKVVALGYLDEVNFFLDYSEHDLFIRARIQKGWICGYVAIDFLSPFEDGSTRKPRNAANEMIFQQKSVQCGKNGFMHKWLASRPDSIPFTMMVLPNHPNFLKT